MNRSNPHDWRVYLHQLPEADAPAAVWQRIAAARRAAPRPRSRWLPAAGLAAAVSLAAVLTMQRPPATVDAPVAVVPMAAPVESVALRALDDALALAYARDATQEEIDSLWQTRERLLDGGADAEPLLARL